MCLSICNTENLYKETTSADIGRKKTFASPFGEMGSENPKGIFYTGVIILSSDIDYLNSLLVTLV